MSVSTCKHTYRKTFHDLKIGDRLRVRSKEWYDSNKGYYAQVTSVGTRNLHYDIFSYDMAYFCGKEVTVSELTELANSGYNEVISIEEDDQEYQWHIWMFEGGPEVDEIS